MNKLGALFNPRSIPIKVFNGEHKFLSNFFYSPICYDGIVYETAEHAYQAQKTNDKIWKERIRSAPTPAAARRTGKFVIIKPEWGNIKLDVMEQILKIKFGFGNSNLRKMLLATGTKELIEGNTWNDTFWGVCDGKGENHLGIILMKIRAELKC